MHMIVVPSTEFQVFFFDRKFLNNFPRLSKRFRNTGFKNIAGRLLSVSPDNAT